MNQKKSKLTPRIITILFISCLCVSAFMWSKFTTKAALETKTAESQNDSPQEDKNIGNESQTEITVNAAKRGFPLLNLQDGKKLGTKYTGAANSPDAATTPLKPSFAVDDSVAVLILFYFLCIY